MLTAVRTNATTTQRPLNRSDSAPDTAIIEAKQEALAEALGVRQVSKPVALRHILEDAVESTLHAPEGTCCKCPSALEVMKTTNTKTGGQA